MKKTLISSLVVMAIMFISNASHAKELKYSYEVEFGNSKEEKILQFNGNGKLNITGYNGHKVLLSSNEDVFKEDEENEKAKGLKKIGGGGFNILNNKDKNIIIVSRPGHENVDLDVKVPNNITLKIGTGVTKPSNGFHFSPVHIIAPAPPASPSAPDVNVNIEEIEKLAKNFEIHTKVIEKHAEALEKQADKLEKNAEALEKHITIVTPRGHVVDTAKNTPGGAVTYFTLSKFNGSVDGDITINDFKGLVEASTVQGNIAVNNMDGIVLANTVEGDITVLFRKLTDDKELYLSTVEGDIDITFPEKTNADVMAKTTEGDVYSGFDGEVSSGIHPDGKKESKDAGHYFGNMFQADYVTTRLNKGGQDVYLNTVKGSIYIRKGE